MPGEGRVPGEAGARRALLVGCTKYELAGVPELWGPANDIPLWRKTLVDSFGFGGDDVAVLLGWPEDPSRRPTRSNIAAAFERLIAESRGGDHVVIVLSGHGAQIPVPEENDFKVNPEPDGLDEVFLPADVKAWAGGVVENAIKDDEIGAWLDRLRVKGAHAWIVFDCCHSGTMTRAASTRERPRSIRPLDLGVPTRAIAEAARKAKEAGPPLPDAGPVVGPARVDAEPTGSLVAFYAAQPFEESPELPRPEDAALVPENYFGLFTYTLISALTRRQVPLTYRDLSQQVNSLYRSERKSKPPTAFVEGDLDREVLGLRTWPERSDILLTHDDGVGEFDLSEGELQGMTPGSILAVHPPTDDPRGMETVLGHVEVVAVAPTSSRSRPTRFERGAVADPASLPDRARCTIVARGVSGMRVTYAVLADDQGAIRQAIASMAEDLRAQFLEVAEPERADWWLRSSEGRVCLELGQAAETPIRTRVAESYPAQTGERLAAGLTRDLRKIFRWQNLWRVAGAMGNNPPQSRDLGLHIEVKVLRGEGDREGIRLEDRPVLNPGQWIEIRLRNDGPDDLWVTLLALDARFGIQDVPVVSIPARSATRPQRYEVTNESFGSEGLVALALPIDANRDRPRFDFLIQEPMGRPDAERFRGFVPKNPFEEFLKAAAFGGQARSIRKQASTEPQISSVVWLTRPN
ncbi:MAG: caspase family protein [Isosphaeraceae bacterium]